MTTELEISIIKRAVREVLIEADEKYVDDHIGLEIICQLIANRIVEIRIEKDCDLRGH